ncbi:MAG: sulfatase/phosphatase domain-containing protein, partial [Verrucomicrobiota bacterium]
LRIPSMVRWPGKITPGQVSDHLFYQPDVLPTLTELANANTPADIDGISFLPTILGKGEQKKHPFLYWEFGRQTAVRIGKWKGIHNKRSDQWELFDLSKDVSEAQSLADRHPVILEKMRAVASASHTPIHKGSYSDPERKRHEKDRNAKWGTSKDRPKPKKPRRKKAL